MMSENDLRSVLEAAGSLYDEGKSLEAVAAYEKILIGWPDCSEAWLMLGSLYGEMGQLDKAEEYVEKSITLAPDDAAAHLTLGHLRSASGDTDAAIESFNNAVMADPGDAEVHGALGAVLQKSGDLDKAIEAYEKAVACNPELEEIWAVLGALHHQTGNSSRALECYQAALTLGASDESIIAGWCELLAEAGTSPESVALLDKQIAVNRGNPEACFRLAVACSKLGRHNEATECIDEVLGMKPEVEEYILGKAEILERRGDFQDTFLVLKPYLLAKPPNQKAVFILARFSHIVGLREECIKLLGYIRDDEDSSPEVRAEVVKAIDWVSSVDISGNV